MSKLNKNVSSNKLSSLIVSSEEAFVSKKDIVQHDRQVNENEKEKETETDKETGKETETEFRRINKNKDNKEYNWKLKSNIKVTRSPSNNKSPSKNKKNNYNINNNNDHQNSIDIEKKNENSIKNKNEERPSIVQLLGYSNIHTKNRASLLSAEAGEQNFRGLLNLAAIILVVMNARLVVENLLKYGVLIELT